MDVQSNIPEIKKTVFVEAKNKRSEAALDLFRFAKAFPVEFLGKISGAAALALQDIDEAYEKGANIIFNALEGSLGSIIALPILFTAWAPIKLASLVMKAAAEFFGFEEQVKFKPSAQAIANNNSALEFLKKFEKLEATEVISSKDYTPSSILPEEGGISQLEKAANLLKCCLSAVEKLPNVEESPNEEIRSRILFGSLKLEGQEEKLRGLTHVINTAIKYPGAESTKGIQIYFERSYLKAGGKDIKAFRNEITKFQGIHAPKELNRTFEATINEDGQPKTVKFAEKATNINSSLGAKFLKATGRGENYKNEISYIEAHGQSGVKLSRERVNSDAQGMLVNGLVHSVTSMVGDNIISKSILRSGAFAIQDGAKEGLDGLKEKKAEIDSLTIDIALSKEESEFRGMLLDAQRQDLDREIGGKNIQEKRDAIMDRLANEEDEGVRIEKKEAKLAALIANFEKVGGDKEIKRRTDLTVSQALPKISASIKEMAKQPGLMQNVLKTGAFLHVEQSFLSDRDKKERAMIEDMKGAMDYIKENATVKFTNDSKMENVEINSDGEILLTLYVEDLKEVPEKMFRLNTVFFTQGVNEQQSIGHLFGSRDSYQDKVNEKSLADLLSYAQFCLDDDIGVNKDALKSKIDEIKEHFNEENVREGKDIKGVRLIDNLVEILGGSRGVVCKSGKDRTGAEVNDSLASGMAEKLSGGKEEIKKDLHREARKRLEEGISLDNTERNTGNRGYSFNVGQLKTLRWWGPSKHLCNPKSDS